MLDIRNLGCIDCLWVEQCGIAEEVCEDFSPADELNCDYINYIIEENRSEFHSNWMDYIGFSDEY